MTVHNSPLAMALVAELEPDAPATQCDFDRLSLSTTPYLQRNLEFLNDCLDETVQARGTKLKIEG